MEILTIFVSFLLGMTASLIGARSGRALDERVKILNDFADWVDETLEYLYMYYHITAGKEVWDKESSLTLRQKRMIGGARWIGITKRSLIGGGKINDSMQTFLRSSLDFENLANRMNKDGASGDLNQLKEKLLETTDDAENLHAVIADYKTAGLPRWLIRTK